MQRRWYSIRETAEYFGLRSPKTLYGLIGKGMLPPAAVLRIGRQIRINIEAIENGGAIKGLR